MLFSPTKPNSGADKYGEPARPPFVPVAFPIISPSKAGVGTPAASAQPCPLYVAVTRSRSSHEARIPTGTDS
ncbi:unannotated protein [freshwater metagenome]|uniref:Unannotated protein n=1 Tax=freshwater metagenome TaxID=449393 RepID=A0A6J6GX14_9ZZZZ